MTVTRITEFTAAENKATDLYEFLKSLIPYISSCEGCSLCEVLQNVDNELNFTVIEKWDSIDSHKKSVENFPKEEAMSLLEKLPTAAYFRVYDI